MLKIRGIFAAARKVFLEGTLAGVIAGIKCI